MEYSRHFQKGGEEVRTSLKCYRSLSSESAPIPDITLPW